MAINVSQPFHRTSAGPIDDSLNLSKAQMLLVNDNLMPSKWFTVCADDGKFYLYDKSNEPDEVTGKFRLYQEEEMPAEDMSEIVTPLPSIKKPYDVYSTKEQRIGFWIDGKPLYQKTIIPSTTTPLPNKDILSIPTGLTAGTIDTLVKLEGMIKENVSLHQWRTLPMIQDNNSILNTGSQLHEENGIIYYCILARSADLSVYDFKHATLQYTKTTDTPEPMYISIPVD